MNHTLPTESIAGLDTDGPNGACVGNSSNVRISPLATPLPSTNCLPLAPTARPIGSGTTHAATLHWGRAPGLARRATSSAWYGQLEAIADDPPHPLLPLLAGYSLVVRATKQLPATTRLPAWSC